MTAWTVPSYAEWAVPGYTEERLLGHGVSGRVVAAVNDATGQRVAIKYLHEKLVRDTEFLGELRSEAERLVSINAPHMVRVFDYVEQPGEGAAIVMELVDGVSLREMLARRGPLGAAAALVVLKDLLLALAAAHSQGLPHRDVKPDNVLIDARGWCTLTDFGVAVKTDKQMRAPGTPEYMAPELWHGAPNVPATDIYAATAVLCESLTGKPPFSGRAGRLRDHHESTPVPLDEFDPPLQDLIAWGLAKDPAARPRNAMSFASELEERAAAAYGPYWEDEGRRELAEREAELLPLLEGGAGGGSARVTRLARRKMLTFVSVAAVAVIALVGAGAVVLAKTSGNQVQLNSVSATAVDAQITVTPPVVTSKCATPTTFTFTGSITDSQPGPLSYQWLYSSGKQGPVQTLNFTTAGQQQVGGGTVTTSTAGDGWAQLKLLLNPGSTTSDKATYQLLCSYRKQRHSRVDDGEAGGADLRLMLGPAPDPDRHRHDHEQEPGNGQLLLGDVRRGAHQTGHGDLRLWWHASRGRADVPGVGARGRERDARGDQPGRRVVQAGGVQGILRARGRGRRGGGYPGFREIVGDPESLDRGADVRHDLGGAGPDHQQPSPGADDCPRPRPLPTTATPAPTLTTITRDAAATTVAATP